MKQCKECGKSPTAKTQKTLRNGQIRQYEGSYCITCKNRRARRNKKAKKELDKCAHCSRPAPKKRLCEACETRAQELNIKRDKLRNLRSENGLCKECGIKQDNNTKLCCACRDNQYKRNAKRRLKLKIEVLRHYADTIKCEKCGIKNIEFLTIDHIEGGGNHHRKEIKKSGNGFYLWLKKNGYPEGYRVLCFNCNITLGLFGYCPQPEFEPAP